MASAADTAGESSVAQRLQEHHVVVEDVSDEDLPHPTAEVNKAANKPKKALDTQSHDLFPELGASKGKSSNVAPIWGAKTSANGGASNGASPPTSNPVSGAATPSQGAAPSMFIPGRNVESVTLEPQFILPRNQLKRPIADIIKDINRKSRANITVGTSSNGRLRFDATGPQDVAQQALKDLVQQIGTRVCGSFHHFTTIKLTIYRSLSRFLSRILLVLTSLARAVP